MAGWPARRSTRASFRTGLRRPEAMTHHAVRALPLVLMVIAIAGCSAGPATSPAAIQGKLCYPAERVPAFDVYAVRTDDSAQSPLVLVTKDGQSTYRIDDVPPGTYHVFVYADDPAYNNIGGAYTRFVPCGMDQSCEDHTLIDVVVRTGQTVSGVDPCDFYASQFLPPRPSPHS